MLGPGLRCYSGTSYVDAIGSNCEDVFPGTKYCAKITRSNTLMQSCGAPHVVLQFKRLGLQGTGCITNTVGEFCLCAEDYCN